MHTRQGTKRLYEIDRTGVTALRDWVDGFCRAEYQTGWEHVLGRYVDRAS